MLPHSVGGRRRWAGHTARQVLPAETSRPVRCDQPTQVSNRGLQPAAAVPAAGRDAAAMGQMHGPWPLRVGRGAGRHSSLHRRRQRLRANAGRTKRGAPKRGSRKIGTGRERETVRREGGGAAGAWWRSGLSAHGALRPPSSRKPPRCVPGQPGVALWGQRETPLGGGRPAPKPNGGAAQAGARGTRALPRGWRAGRPGGASSQEAAAVHFQRRGPSGASPC
jgi:hypothetical protein